MKKLVLLVVSLMVISVALIGCGKGNDSNTPKVEVQKAPAEAIGTWYSTRPDTLTIEDNGVYTSEWLTMKTKGTYTVKDGVLSLKGMDGALYTFKVAKEGNQKTLYFKDSKSSLEYTYYDTKEKVDKLIAKKKAADKEAAETAKNTQFKEVQNNLVGTWVGSVTESTIEFTADGKYKFKNFKENVWNYTIIDGETLEIKKDTGETYKSKIKITKTNTGYEMLFDSEKFTKK